MRKDDTIRLRHMLDAAQEAMGFVQGRTRADLNDDRKLVLALVKDIEIIGEAAFPGASSVTKRLLETGATWRSSSRAGSSSASWRQWRR